MKYYLLLFVLLILFVLLTFFGVKFTGELFSSALLLGLCNINNRNIFNAKALSSTKVTVSTTSCHVESIGVGCEGGPGLSGALLGDVPVLTCVNGCGGALVKLEGNVVIVSGQSVKDVVQELGAVTEVRRVIAVHCL